MAVRAISALLGMFVAAVAPSQLITDQVPRSRTVPALEQLRAQVSNSRFRLGPLRLTPELRLTNAGYDNNVFGASEGEEKVEDWSATVSGGLYALVPIGTRVFLKADVLPSYVWYQELKDQRTFGGTYRLGVLAFLNRASLEVSGYSSKGLEFLTSESETRAIQVFNDIRANLELDLTGKLSAFVGAEYQQVLTDSSGAEPDEPTFDINNLDRYDGVARAGVRYRISRAWDVSVAVEGTRTEFRFVGQERDNLTQAYLLGVHYSRPRFFVNVSGGYREGRPTNASTFPEYQTATGSYFVSYFLRRKVELQAYGSRRATYALSSTEPYFFETRNGAALSFQVRPRLSLRGFGELGQNDYRFLVAVEGQEIDREDRSSAYGGGFSLLFFRKMVLSANATRSKYDSPVPGLDRSVVRFTTNLTF